eukprot:gnl/TRDRNA2_/TRDRNA2_159716_c0_seq2.p1 gnl/TRDRNA2_/TRDRNA2_159716_c0~~gnl/TRDRNA2_/TRDRNA2_159716_c0_seq2.p1  ORF type:complete len:339 (+),score=45.99 gnl/TRDRNA2_/TRDRNA2_159716_c0_seq2:21-1037(+)
MDSIRATAGIAVPTACVFVAVNWLHRRRHRLAKGEGLSSHERSDAKRTQKVLSNRFSKKTYSAHCVHGLTVWIETECDEVDVLACLECDVGLVAAAYPPVAWQQILACPFQIWVNEEFCYEGDGGRYEVGRGACVHHSKIWLRDHGNLPDKVCGLEIYRWQDYKSFDLKREGVLAHEFAHCHHAIQGWDQPDIKSAFAAAMSSQMYKSVAHIDGGPARKAYACTNATEFFASLSVPFFGFTNDYFPFSLKDLIEFDPQSHAMLEKVWSLSAAEGCGDAGRAVAEKLEPLPAELEPLPLLPGFARCVRSSLWRYVCVSLDLWWSFWQGRKLRRLHDAEL